MTYQIATRSVKEQPTAACRAVLPANEVGPWLARTYGAIADYLLRVHVSMAGPPYARYRFADGQMEIEAGFPVARAVENEGEICAAVLPGGPVAITTHLGPYEALEDAYKAVIGWLAEHGYEAAGPHWEVYFTDPAEEPDRSRWRTDVVVPYVPIVSSLG